MRKIQKQASTKISFSHSTELIPQGHNITHQLVLVMWRQHTPTPTHPPTPRRKFFRIDQTQTSENFNNSCCKILSLGPRIRQIHLFESKALKCLSSSSIFGIYDKYQSISCTARLPTEVEEVIWPSDYLQVLPADDLLD